MQPPEAPTVKGKDGTAAQASARRLDRAADADDTPPRPSPYGTSTTTAAWCGAPSAAGVKWQGSDPSVPCAAALAVHVSAVRDDDSREVLRVLVAEVAPEAEAHRGAVIGG